jgi:hypothetical protein
MNNTRLYSALVIFLGALGPACAQQTDLNNKPSATFGNTPKPTKDSKFRIIEGTVKDQADNPVAGAIVQLKDDKTSKVVSFPTKDDGKFAFRDLSLTTDYELLAKRGDLATPWKKVSIYDTRKNVIVNFRLEPSKQP